MSSFQKIICMAVIIIQFIIIIAMKISSTKNADASVIGNNSQVHQLYSFYRTNKEGKKELIQFTAYSSQKYIFCTISNHCHHCQILKNKLNEFLLTNKINKKVKLIFLTESIDNIGLEASLPLLKLDRDDLLQFGFNTPTIFAVNGQGKVLFNHSGYYAGLFRDALETITIDKNRGN